MPPPSLRRLSSRMGSALKAAHPEAVDPKALQPKALDSKAPWPKVPSPKASSHFSAAPKAPDPRSSHRTVLARKRSTCPSPAHSSVPRVVSIEPKAFSLPQKASVPSAQGGPLTSLQFAHSHPPPRMVSFFPLQHAPFPRCLQAIRACVPSA